MHGRQLRIQTNWIISDRMSFMPLMIPYLSPCAVENHMVSLVIMIFETHKMQLGSLGSGTPRRRSLCRSPPQCLYKSGM